MDREFFTSQPVYWREAALCAPALPVLLLAGLLTGQVGYGAVAAGAAFSVGFGAARDLRGRRWGAMFAAVAGTTLTAFVGCVAGQWEIVLMIIAGLAAAACAVLALYDEDLWWVSLQMVIALLVAGHYSGPPAVAAVRAAAVFGGGAAQVLIVMILARLAPSAAGRLPPAAPKDPPEGRLVISHAIRAAVCVAIALAIAWGLGLANSYWAPMTAMLILKPGLSDTHTRGVARFTGTVVGCLLASLYAFVVSYNAPLLLVGMGFTAFAAYALQKAHYAILTSAVTATVVLLLSISQGGHAFTNAEHRLIATLVGGVVALIIARIAPHRPLVENAPADRVGAAA
jgi:Fusaric acid resistance protein-like